MKRFIKVVFVLVAALALIVVVLEMTSSYHVSKTINTDAPVITRQQIVIHAPVETVWQVFSNVNNWPEWQKEIPVSKIDSTFSEGASFNWKSNGLTIRSTLHTVKPNEEAGWSGPAFGAFAIHTWHFTEQGDSTLVVVNESMEGWLVTLFKKRFQSGLDSSIIYWLKALKAESERKYKRPVFS